MGQGWAQRQGRGLGIAGAALVLGLLSAVPGGAQTPFRAVATVNESLITAYDVDQRARIIAALGGSQTDSEALGNAALDQLIDDRLKMQAAKRAGLEPTPEIITAGVSEVAGQLGTQPEVFVERLRSAGVSDGAIEDLVAGQMLWRELVRARFRGRIELGEAEIDAEIALAGGSAADSFRIQEIGLPARDGGRTEAETRELAERLYRELSAGGDFAAAVAQYSRAPSAQRGGEVGWVPAADMPPAIRSQVAQAAEGDVLPPQPVQGGFSILRVVARRGGPGADPAADPALRERVRREMTTQRLDLLSQGLIQELRRDAMIEVR